MIDKKLLRILKIKRSIEVEKAYLKEHPEKRQFCDLRLQHLHGKMASLLNK